MAWATPAARGGLDRSVRSLAARLGVGATVALGLVALSGLVVLSYYEAHATAARRDLEAADTAYAWARSVHLWSSRALLAATGLHLARVWWEARVSGVHRRTYLLGAAGFGAAALAHWTGHVLRWDDAGRRLAEFQAAALGGMGGPLADPSAPRFLNWELPFHVAVAGGLVALLVVLHLGTAQGGLLANPDARLRRDARAASVVVGVVTGVGVLAAALILGAPASSPGPAWPFGPFEAAARWTDHGAAFAASGLAAWGLVVVQPWLARWAWAMRSTQLALGLVALAAFVPR